MTVFLFFISGLINSSIISKSSLPLFFFFSIFFLLLKRKAFFDFFCKFNRIDLFFLLFYICCILGVMFSEYSDRNKLYTQLINVVVFYVMYRSASSIFKGEENIVSIFFYTTSMFIVLNLALHFYGFINQNLIRSLIYFFNNSGAYSLGGIYLGIGDWIPRFGGLMPEPSFMSAYIAINIGMFFLKEDKKKRDFLLLFISLVALFLTYGRTGLLGIVLYVYIAHTNWKLKVLSAIFFFALILYYPSIFYILKNHDLSSEQRLTSILYALEGTIRSPLFGNGFGAFYYDSISKGADFKDIFFFYFNLLYSTGFIGVVLFFLFLYSHVVDIVTKRLVILFFSIMFFIPSYSFLPAWLILSVARVLGGLKKKTIVITNNKV